MDGKGSQAIVCWPLVKIKEISWQGKMAWLVQGRRRGLSNKNSSLVRLSDLHEVTSKGMTGEASVKSMLLSSQCKVMFWTDLHRHLCSVLGIQYRYLRKDKGIQCLEYHRKWFLGNAACLQKFGSDKLRRLENLRDHSLEGFLLVLMVTLTEELKRSSGIGLM